MSEIGGYLKKLREEAKLSLREAAKRSGLSHSYINSLESGKHPTTKVPINPSPESLKRLADAYRYPYPILMKVAGYVDNMEPLLEAEIDNNDLIRLIEKYRLLDFTDDKLLSLPMYYDGMELTDDEKKEFISIARAIFSVRKASKEKP